MMSIAKTIQVSSVSPQRGACDGITRMVAGGFTINATQRANRVPIGVRSSGGHNCIDLSFESEAPCHRAGFQWTVHSLFGMAMAVFFSPMQPIGWYRNISCNTWHTTTTNLNIKRGCITLSGERANICCRQWRMQVQPRVQGCCREHRVCMCMPH